MISRPWPYAQRLIDRMADSSVPNHGVARTPRSGGIHASQLLRELHPVDADNGIDEKQLAIYGLLGLAFEDRAELALLSLSEEADWPWRCFRPGEVEQDGIVCSPDILLVPKGDGAIRELSLKVTWKSYKGIPDEEAENEFPSKFDYYLDQCKTYAMPLDTLGSILLVYFVRGNYTGASFPQVKGWELDFSAQEVAEHWDVMLNIAAEKRR